MKKMKNLLVVLSLLVAVVGLAGCASTNAQVNEGLVGVWSSENNGSFVFRSNGEGTQNFTVGSALEIKWSSTDTQITTYPKVMVMSMGMAKTTYDYVLDGDTLMLNGIKYTKAQ